MTRLSRLQLEGQEASTSRSLGSRMATRTAPSASAGGVTWPGSAVGLVVLGLALLVIEAHVPTAGLLGSAGAAVLVLGAALAVLGAGASPCSCCP